MKARRHTCSCTRTEMHTRARTAEWEKDRVRGTERESEKEEKKIRKYQLSSSDSSANRHQEVGGGECLRVCVCVLDKGVEGVWLELRSLTFALSVLYLCKFWNNSLPWGVNNLLRRLAIIKSLSLFIVVCWQFPIICCIVAPCTHLYIDF